MRTELMGMEDVRKEFRQRLELANPQPEPGQPPADPVHTAVTQRGKFTGVLVGPEWYRQARRVLGDPTDL